MRLRPFSPWHRAVALAPLLLLALWGPGEVLLRCRIDGLLRPACCCPTDDAPPSPGPTMQASDCCDRQLTDNERAPFETPRAAGPDVARLAVVVAAPPGAPAAPSFDDRLRRPRQRPGPARGGPATLLQKSAFLI